MLEMRKGKTVLLLFLLGVFTMAGCNNNDEGGSNKSQNVERPTLPIPEDSVLINDVKTNLRGLNMEDFSIAMEPLDLSSPFMSEAENAMRGAFMVFEMEFRLHKVDIQFKSDSVCYAIVEHDSRNHNERTYDAQRSQQRYTWRPVQGEWKIHKMEVLGMTPVEY